MKYAKMLKELFPGAVLTVEDLLFLEPSQIKNLPDRVLKPEFAVLLETNPVIHRYLTAMCPSISSFIDTLLKEQIPVLDRKAANKTPGKTAEKKCQALLWEIADLIIYSKYPEVYDANIKFPWDVDEIISPEFLKGKVVIDAGAGPGKLAFKVARFAGTVFAVEPVLGFRRFIKKKTRKENVNNLFAIDGTLDSIPFPDHSIDILMTSDAIGWNLEEELKEIERVLKPGGRAVHLFRNFDADIEMAEKLNAVLVSSQWQYDLKKYAGKDAEQRSRYSKIIRQD